MASMFRRVAGPALLLLAGAASAQMLGEVKAAPAAVRTGEPVTVTVEFEVSVGANCGVRLHWGDGTTEDFKINQTKDVPLVVRHAWPQPGSYTVKAEPKTNGMTPKCGGRNRETVVAVSAPAQAAPVAAAPVPAAAPAPAAMAMAPTGPCPAGWSLNKGGVGKNGAFTCSAKPDTALPAQRVSCTGDLTYFENARRGQFGCRP